MWLPVKGGFKVSFDYRCHPDYQVLNIPQSISFLFKVNLRYSARNQTNTSKDFTSFSPQLKAPCSGVHEQMLTKVTRDYGLSDSEINSKVSSKPKVFSGVMKNNQDSIHLCPQSKYNWLPKNAFKKSGNGSFPEHRGNMSEQHINHMYFDCRNLN